MTLTLLNRIEYCADLAKYGKDSRFRSVFNRALRALPATQHEKLWKLCLNWIKSRRIGVSGKQLFRRYLIFDPSSREEYIALLKELELYDEAALQLYGCLNDESFKSKSGQTPHTLWMDLCSLCATHPRSIVNKLNVEAIIESGIHKFSDEVGKLWNFLAEFYIRLGLFEKARDVYEQALASVSTVRDFTLIFDAYVKVEESILTAKMRYVQNLDDSDPDIADETDEINLRLARIEYLMEARPLLLNSVLLRQTPNSIALWRKRVKLLSDNPQKVLLTFAEAVKIVDPKRSIGKFSTLWIQWARTYENLNDFENSREIYENAVAVDFRTPEELAEVVCARVEMEIRNKNLFGSLMFLRQVLDTGKSKPEFKKLIKSIKVWALYLDLEEFCGTFDSCKSAYERALEVKVITIQMVINYATILEEHSYYEESFTVYEKAVNIFEFPQVKLIWKIYLDKFTARYGNSKVHRIRDLYEQLLSKCPKEDLAEFYYSYVKMEETFGNPRNVITIFDKAMKSIPENFRLDLCRLYIRKVEQLFGVLKTRSIYTEALKILNDESARQLCLEYSKSELRLGEIDRARAILQYGSQFADPKRFPEYWITWRNFEEHYGNEETFKDMLRIQRSLEAAFSQVMF